MAQKSTSSKHQIISSRPLVRLIDEARSGDSRAFAELVRRFRRSLVIQATGILRDRDLAEDAVQEAWVEAHKKLDDLRSNAAFASWMRRIVFKYCDRILRKPSEDATPPDEFSRIEDLRQSDDYLIRHDVERMLARLPALDRFIVVSFFREGKSQAEIAVDMQLPLHTVKNRLRRARQDLRQLGRSVMLNVARTAA